MSPVSTASQAAQPSRRAVRRAMSEDRYAQGHPDERMLIWELEAATRPTTQQRAARVNVMITAALSTTAVALTTWDLLLLVRGAS